LHIEGAGVSCEGTFTRWTNWKPDAFRRREEVTEIIIESTIKY